MKLLKWFKGEKPQVVSYFTVFLDWLSLIEQINVDLSRQFGRAVGFAVASTYIIETGLADL